MAIKDIFTKAKDTTVKAFGEDQVGFSDENKAIVRKYTGALSPVVESAATTGDVAMRGLGALWAGGANLAGGFADEEWFDDKISLSKAVGRPGSALERDINLAGTDIGLLGVFARPRKPIEKPKANLEDTVKGLKLKPVPPPIEQPMWVSGLEENIASAKTTKASAQEWRNILSKKTNKEEMEFSGLDDFLDSAQDKITKQQLLEHVKANKIQINEVVRDDAVIRDAINFVAKKENMTADEVLEKWGYTEDADYILLARGKGFEVPRDYNKTLTKYGNKYTLPGDLKNYKEMLLTLPEKPFEKPKLTWETFKYPFETVYTSNIHGLVITDLRNGKYKLEEGSGITSLYDSLDEAKAAAQDSFRYPMKDKVNYTHTHFPDVKNPLVHTRFRDFETPDGKKILHIEEIQSDWHQQGRKAGYQQKPLSEKDIEVKRISFKEAEDLFGFLHVEDIIRYREKNSIPISETITVYRLKGKEGWNIHYDPTTPEKEVVKKSILDADPGGAIGIEINRRKQGLPNAPFKDTKAWTELALKKLLRYAADNGYDGISWTKGYQQQERYPGPASNGLAKYYDEIVPSVVNKLGSKYGAKTSEIKVKAKENNIEFNHDLHYFPISKKLKNTPQKLFETAAVPTGLSKLFSKEDKEDTQNKKDEQYRGLFKEEDAYKNNPEVKSWMKQNNIIDTGDYDYVAAFKGKVNLDESNHLPDTYKLPNHPTFSNESIHSKGKQLGGVWAKKKNKWVFTPSEWNLQNIGGPDKMQKWFKRYEPDAELNLQKAP